MPPLAPDPIERMQVEAARTARAIDARLLELLQQASNLQLFQLNSVIERMLADPRRILQVRKDLHMGQTVRFMDWRDGRMRVGKVIAFKDTQLTAGIALRQDRIRAVGLYASEDRRRTHTVRQDRIAETAAGLFVQARTDWLPWLRSTVGLRRDEVEAHVTATGGAFNLTYPTASPAANSPR